MNNNVHTNIYDLQMARFCLIISSMFILLITNVFISGVCSLTFTIENKCNQTVWPGLFTSSSTGALSSGDTGFALEQGESKVVNISFSWVGRVWGRTQCAENSTGQFACLTGDCGSGELECSGGPAVPVTVIDFSHDSSVSNRSPYYEVSLTNGYNLPVMVVPQSGSGDGCSSTGCVMDLNSVCPLELKVNDSRGEGVGCNSACPAFGPIKYCCQGCNSACSAFGRPEYCCTGVYGPPVKCKSSKIFKKACPTAYSYGYDDPSSTFTCASGDYFITFCPTARPTPTPIPTPTTRIITQDKPLSDDQLLLSPKENFALGFFSPDNSSSRRYVGIWYNKVSPQTVVWVANRDSPITNKGGVLSLDKSGNLVLFDRQKPDVAIWSTNVSQSSLVGTNYSAELLESGNLVVHEYDNNKSFSWQSFDFPTDTLLPEMKFGVNRRSGKNRFLTSWKSPDNPEPGSYVYMISVNGSLPQMLLYRNSSLFWRGGPWNGLTWSGVPALTSNNIFNVSYIDNTEEVSTLIHMRNTSTLSRIVLNESNGTVHILTWDQDNHEWFNLGSAPNDQCDYFSRCGTFGNCNMYNVRDYECKCLPGFESMPPRDGFPRNDSQGCAPRQEHKVCQRGDGFIKLERVKLPDTTKTRLEMNLSNKGCADLCLKNCSCTGYSAADVSGGTSKGCITWYNELVDLREYASGGQDFYIRVDAAELGKSKRSHSYIKVIVIVLLSAALIVLLTLAYCLIRKKKRAWKRREGIRLLNARISVHRSPKREEVDEMETNGDVKLYSLSIMKAATDNFSAVHKIGEGGFGSVYKGKLQNGQDIAVKRLSNTSKQGMQEFRNEVTLIAKLQHRNLVRLFGYCTEKEEKMLIYEYMPNKGLDCFLFDLEKKYMLDWRKRFDIALGIARGMAYLHHDSRLRIIHRDLKASNVLLDADLNPKIADFGMARLFGGNKIEGTTNRVVGTYGYMAPEYAMEGHFSTKSDVFSFGVLLLEIIIGRKNSSYHTENCYNLIGHVWKLWNESKVSEVVDQSLGESQELDPKVLRCIHIGLLCVQESATARPSMSEVVLMLCNDTSSLPAPGEAAFVLRASDRVSANTNSSSVGAISINEVTLSTVDGR